MSLTTPSKSVALASEGNVMSFMTGSAAIRTRFVLRRLHLTSIAMNILRSVGYEQLLTKAMKRATQPGDCIWDVGANMGTYTKLFSHWVPRGKVYSFEPVPETVDRLTENVGTLPNVKVLAFALSDHTGIAYLDRGVDEDAATARLIESQNGVAIRTQRGDALVEQHVVERPALVKIDVEGHELAVLHGMQALLGDIKHIFIEVHFAIFGATGRDHYPSEIESLLRTAGYSLRWIDQSHLHASR